MSEIDMTRGVYRRVYSNWTHGRRINSVSERAELLFLRLMLIADDYGNGIADAAFVRAVALTKRMAAWTDADVAACMAELATAGLVTLYHVEDQQHYHLDDFEGWQPCGRNGRRIRRVPAPPNGESGGIRGNPEESGGIRKNPEKSGRSESDTDTDTDTDTTPTPPPPATTDPEVVVVVGEKTQKPERTPAHDAIAALGVGAKAVNELGDVLANATAGTAITPAQVIARVKDDARLPADAGPGLWVNALRAGIGQAVRKMLAERQAKTTDRDRATAQAKQDREALDALPADDRQACLDYARRHLTGMRARDDALVAAEAALALRVHGLVAIRRNLT